MKHPLYLVCLGLLVLGLCMGQSCAPTPGPTPEPTSDGTSNGGSDTNGGGSTTDGGGSTTDGGGSGSTVMTLVSSAFANNGPIPIEYTYDGSSGSPPLSWSGVPAGAQELALIVQDLDLPTFYHWTIYGMSASTTSLPAGVPTLDVITWPVAAYQGPNSGIGSGYIGPDPPPGEVHHYAFTLYALDAQLGLQAGMEATDVLAAMQGHIIATAQLVGTYLREW